MESSLAIWLVHALDSATEQLHKLRDGTHVLSAEDMDAVNAAALRFKQAHGDTPIALPVKGKKKKGK